MLSYWNWICPVLLLMRPTAWRFLPICRKTLTSITLFFCPSPIALYWFLGIQIHVFLYMAERVKVFAPA